MKTKILFIVVFLGMLKSIITSGYGPVQYQSNEKTFTHKTEAINKEIQKIKNQIVRITPESHELHDYFIESAGIIERLMGYIKEDIKEGYQVEARLGLKEAEFLSSFLKEELSVTQVRNKTLYKEIDVTESGLKGDGVSDNNEPLRELLAAVEKDHGHIKLLFPEGEYYIKAKPGEKAIILKDQENITFEGLGKVTLIFDGHQAGATLFIQNCKNLEFRNISIDMKPLPFTMGTIVSVIDGNKIIIKICEGYPEPDETYLTAKYLRGLVRNPKTGKIDSSCGDPRVVKFEKLEKNEFLLTLDDNALSGNTNMTENFTMGHYFTFHPRQMPGSENAVNISDSRHLLFSHFNLYAGNLHMFYITKSAGVKFLDCDVEPKEGRLCMNNADGFHCRSNLKGIYLERCKVFSTNDDCMNFYTKLHSVGKVENNNEFIILGDRLNASYKAGDDIAFINSNSGTIDGVTTIRSVKVVEWDGQKNSLFIRTKDPVRNIISRYSAGRPSKIREREYVSSGADNYRAAMDINEPFEHMVMNLGTKNDGFIIRNCHFGYNRATGFKCKATNGVIRNSRFHDQVVLFMTGIDWWEGTYPAKIEVTDVVVDKGIRFSASLPGKSIGQDKVIKYMRHLNFENVRDASGNEILLPVEIK